MADMENKNPKERLVMLINGYEGYFSPKDRQKTCELFEKFISDKVGIMHNFFSKKYDEFVLKQSMLHLIGPLTETIKIFADCRDHVNYARNANKFFFEELRIEQEKEDALCEADLNILKFISIILDKITSYNISNQDHLLKLNEIVTAFKEFIHTRIALINEINIEKKNISDELNEYLKQIRERKATESTYAEIKKLLQKYPERIISYREIANCFRTFASDYLVVRENIGNAAFYREAILFIEQYELFHNELAAYIRKFRSKSPEEEEVFNFIRERLGLVPDFAREKKILHSAILNAESKAARRKGVEDSIHKASIFYEAGYDMEKKMHFQDAVDFYNTAIQIDPKFVDAIEGLKRCHTGKSLFPEFQKAGKFFTSGRLEQAMELYRKIRIQAPDMESVHLMIKRINMIEGKNEQ